MGLLSDTSTKLPNISWDDTTTVTLRAFYDGLGRLIETRAAGPVDQDVVTYAFYDTSGRQIFTSNPYFVPAYTGLPGAGPQPTPFRIAANQAPGSTTTTLASNLGYTGLAEAAGQITSMTLGNAYSYAASYDTGMRLTSASLSRMSDSQTGL